MKSIVYIIAMLLTVSFIYGARVDTVSIVSPSMGKTYKAAVVTPDSYKKSKARFPVLYLLHGAYGHFGDWLSKTSDRSIVHRMADLYNMIIVTPEGETFSFYLDSQVGLGSMFETHIIREVIPFIDSNYRTVSRKEGRAITGLSMGGHGALYLSARNPDMFAAAGSMSGAVDMGMMLGRDNSDQIKNLMKPSFGDQNDNPELYKAHAVLNMTERIKANAIPLIIDCGVDDYLIESNRELHRRLLYLKVPHEYTERPGAHTWEYWGDALPFHLLYFDSIFKKNKVNVI